MKNEQAKTRKDEISRLINEYRDLWDTSIEMPPPLLNKRDELFTLLAKTKEEIPELSQWVFHLQKTLPFQNKPTSDIDWKNATFIIGDFSFSFPENTKL